MYVTGGAGVNGSRGGASAVERRPVYGGKPATPCLPRSATLPLCTHSCRPRPSNAHKPLARTVWQRCMQTCFVNGCGSDRGRAYFSVFFLLQNYTGVKKIATVALRAIGSHLRHFFTPRMRRDYYLRLCSHWIIGFLELWDV